MSTLQLGNNVIISGSGSASPAGNTTGGSIVGIYSAEGIIPTGSVIYTATNIAGTAKVPDGYLPCNGAIVSRVDYSKLYEALGSPTTSNGLWNLGAIGGFPGTGAINYLTSPVPNSTQFRLPYLSGVFIRCWSGPGDFTLDSSGGSGRVFGSFKTDIIPSTVSTTSGSIALMAIIKY
jgi:hypothetical protein